MTSVDPLAGVRLTLEILEGTGPFALREARETLSPFVGDRGTIELAGPTEITVPALSDPRGAITASRTLRRVVAAYATLSDQVRRPREWLETSRQQRIAAVLDVIRTVKPRTRFTALRLGAAGSGSEDMQRLAASMAELAGVPVDEDDGDLFVRVRRAPEHHHGWEVLIRTTPRPLSARSWRVADYPGAVNATIAACVLDLLGADTGAPGSVGADAGPDADPTGGRAMIDLMCGSGTLLIEELFRARPGHGLPERIVGCDVNPEALEAARSNQRAARRKGRIDWVDGDVFTAPIAPPFTHLVANPPWGALLGTHEENEAMHPRLLARAAGLAAQGARFVVLTHEVHRFEAAIAAQHHWKLRDEVRFFQKGHHPRAFVLES